MSPQVCLVCISPFRDELEKRMVHGCNLTELAKEFSIGYESVWNHFHEHLPSSLSEIFVKQQLMVKHDLLNEIEDMLSNAKEIFQRNKDLGKDVIALKALQESRSVIELLSKIVYAYHQAKVLEAEMSKKDDSVNKAETLTEFIQKLPCLTYLEHLMLEALITKTNSEGDYIIIPDPDPDDYSTDKEITFQLAAIQPHYRG